MTLQVCRCTPTIAQGLCSTTLLAYMAGAAAKLSHVAEKFSTFYSEIENERQACNTATPAKPACYFSAPSLPSPHVTVQARRHQEAFRHQQAQESLSHLEAFVKVLQRCFSKLQAVHTHSGCLADTMPLQAVSTASFLRQTLPILGALMHVTPKQVVSAEENVAVPCPLPLNTQAHRASAKCTWLAKLCRTEVPIPVAALQTLTCTC